MLKVEKKKLVLRKKVFFVIVLRMMRKLMMRIRMMMKILNCVVLVRWLWLVYREEIWVVWGIYYF